MRTSSPTNRAGPPSSSTPGRRWSRCSGGPPSGASSPRTSGGEWGANPFVGVWRGAQPEGTEPCRVGGRDATLIVWSPDYDGKGKAWVRFADGQDAIVGGSRIER